jgi:ASC-1-like (ASCH) protein
MQMKKLIMVATAALCASVVNAAELAYVPAGAIQTLKIEVPAPVLETAAVKCGHVSGEITKLHLLAQAGRSQLFTYAENEAQFKEFTAMWQPILEKFGMKVTGTEYKDKFGIMTYSSPDGRVVRSFLAEKLHYDALNAAGVQKLQHELLEPLEQAGMTPIASFNIKHEAFRPTFNIYYLTKPEADQARELQLRQLMNGDDIDFDLLKDAVQTVKQDTSFSLVYIGRELGFKSKLAADEAGINAKLADYKKFLAENKKDFIAARTYKLDAPIEYTGGKFNYVVNMYFFQ